MIDPKFFAKYQPSSGFKFILDAANNIPKDFIVNGFYSLNPPGEFYNSGESDKLVLNSLINWDSPLGQT